MLQYVTGDSVFFPVMRQYFRDRAYSVAETEDLLAHFEKYVPNPAVPFRTFFEQWLYKRGHPIYEASFKTTQESATEYKASLTLKQVQTGENVPEVFVMPVSLTFEGAKGETQTVTLLNNSRQQNFQIITPYPVVALYIDRDENILAVKADTVTSVEEAPALPEGGFAVMPNPVSGAGEFSVNISVHLPDSKVYIALYDMTGRIAEVIHDGIFPAGNYTIARQNNLPTGVYYVRATVDGKTFAAPLTVVK